MDKENTEAVSNEENENTNAQDSETTTTEESGTNSDSNNDTNNVSSNVNDNEARFSRLESTLERVLGEISAIREAQGILVENGAVITDTDADLDFTDADAFVPPAELDLLI